MRIAVEVIFIRWWTLDLRVTKFQQFPTPQITSMESSAIAKPVWTPPGLSTLPQEIRNQIYGYLIVSSKPIKVCFGNNPSLWIYLRAGRQNKDISIGCLSHALSHAVKGSQFAQEVYEDFFRNNFFDCGTCENLRRFLTTSTTRLNSQNTLVPISTNDGYLKFEKESWICKVKVSICFDIFERRTSKNLSYLLRCPGLQQVEIRVFGLSTNKIENDPVDIIIEAAIVCKSIREKIGSGLIVNVQKDWLDLVSTGASTSWLGESLISNPEIEDVSWMWEVPSKEARLRVKIGVGTHREKISVLMSTGWARRKGKVGAWAEYWREEHNEQQRRRRLSQESC